MTDLRHKERAKMRKYHCELWITKPEEAIECAKKMLEVVK